MSAHDADNSGELSREELASALDSLLKGFPKEQLSALADYFDEDHSGAPTGGLVESIGSVGSVGSVWSVGRSPPSLLPLPMTLHDPP